MKAKRSSQADQILEIYLNKTAPVQWVAWWSNLPSGKDKSEFEILLFENGQLRALGNENLKADVINFIKNSKALRQVVMIEAKDLIDKIATTVVRGNSSAQ